MNKKMKKFLSISGLALILACLFVPYLKQACNSTVGCVTIGSGFGFIGTLSNSIINIPMLLIELGIIILISGVYYNFFLKDKE